MILFAGLVAVPGISLRVLQEVTGYHLPPVAATLIFGLGILGAAFVISWTAEAAEKDIPQALALAVLALIAVLPEYAVDIYFAWQAPHIEEYRHYAVANMTGANRLLIGLGWPLVFFVYFFKFRMPKLEVDRGHALDVLVLAIASIYSMSIVLKGSLALVDTFFLFALFGGYVFLAGRRPMEEPDLYGPAAAIGSLARRPRRIGLVLLFAYAAIGIFFAAEPFAEGLLDIGHEFGIDSFVLVQWLAPLASEAPELIIASLFVLRNRPGAAMGALIASLVNQWTLLVGCVPLAFSISGGSLEPMTFDTRQATEIFLTGVTAFFGVAIFLSLSISKWEALTLLGLFLSQLAFPDPSIRQIYAYVYLALIAFLLVRHRTDLQNLLRSGSEVVRECLQGAPAAEDPQSPRPLS